MAIDKSNPAKINRWGRKFIFPFAEGSPRAHRIRLQHRAVNGKVAEIQTFDVRGINETDWKTTVEEIASVIADDADGQEGTQTYLLYAVQVHGGDEETGKGGEEEQLSRLAIRQAGDTIDDDESISSEPATSKGLLTQLMRHNEALVRNQTAAFASIIRGQQSMLEQQAQMIERFGAKHMELIEQTEALRSQQTERDLAAADKAAEIENRQLMVSRFMGLLGPIAKKFGIATPDEQLPIEVTELQDFLGGLTEEQLEVLKSTLPPDKVIILMSLMEKNAAREEEARNKPNGLIKHQS